MEVFLFCRLQYFMASSVASHFSSFGNSTDLGFAETKFEQFLRSLYNGLICETGLRKFIVSSSEGNYTEY
jgi:hypothetical protein